MRGVKKISGRAQGVVLLLLLLPLLLAGCSLGTDVDRPEWARVIISAPGSVSLELLISQNFLITESSVQLIEATTDTVTTPFDKRYDLGGPARFYLKATNITGATITFRLKVLLEERNWYDEEKVLAPGESAEFAYRYTEPTID